MRIVANVRCMIKHYIGLYKREKMETHNSWAQMGFLCLNIEKQKKMTLLSDVVSGDKEIFGSFNFHDYGLKMAPNSLKLMVMYTFK